MSGNMDLTLDHLNMISLLSINFNHKWKIKIRFWHLWLGSYDLQIYYFNYDVSEC